jgi:hypothetical protein
MGSVSGELLAPAVVIAVGPLQIIAVILLLFSRRATANSLAFLGGWIVGLTTLSVIALLIERPALESANSNASLVGAIVQLVLGLGLIVLAARQWRTRPRQDQPAKLPDWMASIESVGPARALSIGLLLSVPNVKIVLLTLAAMLAVTEARLSGTQAVVAVLIYVVVASSSVIVPVLGNLLLGERATSSLTALRAWLERHYSTIVVVVLLIIGIIVGGKGLSTLIG